MKTKFPFILLFAGLIVAPATSSSEEPPLIHYMKDLQYFMHKTALSLDAGNMVLVKFYAHEIEETIEQVEEIETYKGYNVNNLIKSVLVPEFEKFENLVDDRKLENANRQFNKLIEACNQCHGSTNNGFIKIKRTTVNPFMQSFE